jgi:hypothetical protein
MAIRAEFGTSFFFGGGGEGRGQCFGTWLGMSVRDLVQERRRRGTTIATTTRTTIANDNSDDNEDDSRERQ